MVSRSRQRALLQKQKDLLDLLGDLDEEDEVAACLSSFPPSLALRRSDCRSEVLEKKNVRIRSIS